MSACYSWSVIFRVLFHFFVFLPILKLFLLWRRIWAYFSDGSLLDDRVEVRRVLWRHKLRQRVGDPFDDVIHAHARFEDARAFAWLDPHVHLMYVSEEGATFVRTGRDENVFDSRSAPFACFDVPRLTVEFAVIPIRRFRRLAEEELESLARDDENDDVKIHQSKKIATKTAVVMSSNPRSGASFILQHLERLPNAVVWNDHNVFVNLYAWAFAAGESRPPLLKHVLFFAFKHLYRLPGVDVVGLKSPVFTPWLIKDAIDLEDQLPFRCSYVFGYRKPIPSMISSLRIFTTNAMDAFGFADETPIFNRFCVELCGARLGTGWAPMMRWGLMGVVGRVEWARRFGWVDSVQFLVRDKILTTLQGEKSIPTTTVSLEAHFFCYYLVPLLTLKELLRMPKYAAKIRPIRYEDLIASPRIWDEEVLPFLGLKAASVTALKSTEKRDSQQQSRYSRTRMSAHNTQLLPRDLKKLDALMKASGLANSLADFEHPF